ncbi:wings apart-like protein homolog [Brachyhypopomus gauderio]|uniref:wings apart-like protein homolog n=1 Tax=Brachyhypopomus gauderio TaxID=698409 RepID=UPI004041DF39
MTSRFSKTYTRKGGEANSKFEEVFANKKATLSTKWGETTYKAQLGTKRPTFKPELPELVKRPRLEEDDGSDDPFGFDSDDESKTVSSRGAVQPDGGAAEAGCGSTTSSTPPDTLSVSGTVPSRGSAALGSGTSKPPSTSNSTPAAEPLQTISAGSSGSAWYKAAGTVSRPGSQSSASKAPTGDSLYDWDPAGQDCALAAGGGAPVQASHLSDGLKPSEQPPGDPPPEEPIHFEPLPLLKPARDRVYHRPGRTQEAESSDRETPGAETSKPATAPVKGAGTAGSEVKAAGRSRVRDYTVLHPSCVSACNVTIQDSIDRSMDEFVNTPPTDLGEAGTFRRKTDAQLSKPTRFRPSHSKTKRESKLEFFGFEEAEVQDVDGEPHTSGSSSYKIKYFGFDDLSDSESEDEEDSAAKGRRKTRKAPCEALTAGMDSPQTSDSQESQTSTNADSQEWLEEACPTGSAHQRERGARLTDKAKEISRKIFSGPKKSPAKAVYNARHWNHPEPEESPPASSRTIIAPKPSVSSGGKDATSCRDEGVFKAPPPPPKVIKSVTIPTEPYQDTVTALKCRKEHKELFTVVQHVKHFNDVVEFGENQEFTDDFEYLETGLKSSQPLNTRCLSIISLAMRCAMPSFRMHLRARGKVAQVFKMLSDAPQHPNLALCTASLMYILSRDRLNMDLDRASLELMIRLLELEQDDSVDDQLTAKEISKVKEKIRKLCETVHNKHLDLENITTGHLAMETLLSLTSKRAGDWFKEELRLLGGLDHIVDKVNECVESLSMEEDKENLVASLWGAERCLRVLESVTLHNPENQAYLIAYRESQLIVSSARGLCYCEEMIQRYSRQVNSSLSSSGTALPHCSHSNVGKAVEDCMRAVIGVLLNLTHDNEWGSTKTGEQDELLLTALNCVLKVPRFLPPEQRFDIRVLGLGLLINLVEYSSRNRHCLVEMKVDRSWLMEAEVKPAQGAEGGGDAPGAGDEERGGTADAPGAGDEERGGTADAPGAGDEERGGTADAPGAGDEERGGTADAPGAGDEERGGTADAPGAGDKDRGGTADSSSALAALVQLFLEREHAAVLAEAQTDDLISEAPKSQADQSGEWQETSGEIQWVATETNETHEKNENEKKEEEEEELDLNKALQHAGKHMEDSIVASYTALLLGCLCQDSPMNVQGVRESLPKGDFSIMTEMLKKFLNFMNLTCSVGTTGQKSITRVIEYLEHC